MSFNRHEEKKRQEHEEEYIKITGDPTVAELNKNFKETAFEFKFFKKWQRSATYILVILLAKISPHVFLFFELWLVLIITILVIAFFCFLFHHKKIIMTDDYIYIENITFGFQSQNFDWQDVKMEKSKFIIFTVLKLDINDKVVYICPFVWQSPQRNMEGLLDYHIFK